MKEQSIRINEFIEKKCVNLLRKKAVSKIEDKFKIEHDDALKQYNTWRKNFIHN